MRSRCVLIAALVFTGCESYRTSRPVPVVAIRQHDPRIVSEPVAAIMALTGTENPSDTTPIDSLALAAECLVRGDEPAACLHFEEYLREHPDQPVFRAQLAALLLKTKKPERARFHYERFVADARECGRPLWAHRVEAHTRLMELAVQNDDAFAESLHRGLGLLVVVEQQDADPDNDVAFREQVLCKAVQALTVAKRVRPDDPRVRLFLAEAYSLMGNFRGADAERRAARNVNRPGSLTPSDQRRLAFP